MTLQEENAKLRQENRALIIEVEALRSRLAELEAIVVSLQKKEKSALSFVKASKPKRRKKKRRKKRAAKCNKDRRRENPTRIETHPR